ncbi:hypothetical protein [Flavisolibacter tropicus]|uniref:Uncharacterized protein n=1 Tax=Flavisolibacter tropicus TaxID=1492898 RepID=A0A172U0T9_9BACT|nr:hypothetical protein [Flavisolibacter tropicus]ANE52643.1 hypothetical protein SY85_21315 [Flavisolibacter tropicus]
MAKQVGPVFITGTIDGIIFYKLGDTYYLRSKGDYKSAKMMRKDPNLKRTMANADRFGVAAKMVKRVYYRQLPGTVRKPGLFARLTGMVNKWLYQGHTKEEAQELLMAHCKRLVEGSVIATPKNSSSPDVNSTAIKSPNSQPDIALPTVAPATKMPVLSSPPKVVKQARYLLKRKVKANGRLQVPKPSVNESARQHEYRYGNYEVCHAENYRRRKFHSAYMSFSYTT